jgi:hypothetical protein
MSLLQEIEALIAKVEGVTKADLEAAVAVAKRDAAAEEVRIKADVAAAVAQAKATALADLSKYAPEAQKLAQDAIAAVEKAVAGALTHGVV